MRLRTLVLALALTGLSAAPAVLSAQMPKPTTHTETWARQHGQAAADGGERAMCTTCHTQAFCSTCHDAARTPSFHQTDYVARHAEDAYTRETDCASCHQAQAFCVTCHRNVGAARTGAPRAAFHDSRSDWMLVHSRVARRSIETCAGCHRQEDCLKCHSASGFARIQPHPAGLDLNHIRSRNPGVCLLCHPGGPPPTP
jgi:hypothetical protein